MDNNIKVLFVPARCDIVINEPLKSGMKAAFWDFLHNDFNNYKGDPAKWSIKLTMGNLKYHIVHSDSVQDTSCNNCLSSLNNA